MGTERLPLWEDSVRVTGDSTSRSTRAAAVQDAVDRAAAVGKSYVYVPERFFNYDASAVTFDNSVRMIREGGNPSVYDVVAYGAAGDSSTDDIDAFNAAEAAANASENRGEIAVPNPGGGSVYALGSTWEVTSQVVIRGHGRRPAIRGTGLSAGEFVLVIDGDPNTDGSRIERVLVEGLTVLSDDGVPNGIQVNNVADSRFDLVEVRDVIDGWSIEGQKNFSNEYHLLTFSSIGGDCFLIDGVNGGQHTFVSCSFSGAVAHGFQVANGAVADGLTFYGCNFEGNGVSGLTVSGASTTVRSLSILGGRAEKNTGSITFDLSPGAGGLISGVSILGIAFETDSERWAVQFGGDAEGFLIAGITVKDYSDDAIRFNGAGDNGIVTGVKLENTPSIANLLRASVTFALSTGFVPRRYTNSSRPAAGTAGRVIFNTDDGQLNIDDGTNWTLPDGTTT